MRTHGSVSLSLSLSQTTKYLTRGSKASSSFSTLFITSVKMYMRAYRERWTIYGKVSANKQLEFIANLRSRSRAVACSTLAAVRPVGASNSGRTTMRLKAHTEVGLWCARARSGKLVFSFGRVLRLSDGDVTSPCKGPVSALSV